MAKRKNKMSTSDAVKVLANESKVVTHQLINTQHQMRDYFSLFELYISWKGDSEEFLKYVQETVEAKQKEVADGQKENESANEKDTGGSVKNEEVGTE
jgi:hypothetical protein